MFVKVIPPAICCIQWWKPLSGRTCPCDLHATSLLYPHLWNGIHLHKLASCFIHEDKDWLIQLSHHLGGVLPLVVKAYVSMAECHLTSLERILRFFSAPFDNNSFVICIYGFKGTTVNLVAFRWSVNSSASRTLEEIKWRKRKSTINGIINNFQKLLCN